MGFYFITNTESMKFLEKDLENIIWESDNDSLPRKGLEIYGEKKIRQKRIGNYGISDIISYSRPVYLKNHGKGGYELQKGTINIFELKKDKISVSSFMHVLGYAKGVETYLEQREKDDLYEIKMTLIGREIDADSAVTYLTDFVDSLEIYNYKYGIDGLEFKFIYNYNLVNKGF
jgi:hypothetical protein